MCVSIIVIATIVAMITMNANAWEMVRRFVVCSSVPLRTVSDQNVFPMKRKLKFSIPIGNLVGGK